MGVLIFMTFRCIITKEKSKYFVGKDYNGHKFRIVKNRNINCKVGDDFYFYANLKEGLFFNTLIPISSKEAGVID